MSSTTNATYLLDSALQQMAAESYLDGVVLANGQVDENLLKVRLRYGANSYTNSSFSPTNPNLPGKTRMTEQQINRFVERFDVVDHRSNDDPRFASSVVGASAAYNGSGFSATLLRDRASGALTLSIRSTEFADTVAGGDWNRDGVGGADGQMVTQGFAFAQLAALEQYYSALKASGKVPAGTAINVTGYSLGAHLATAFTVMHPSEVAQTITFNGPGIGTFNATAAAGGIGPALVQAIARYRAILANPNLGTAIDSSDQTLKNSAVGLNGQALNATNLYNDARQQWAAKVVRNEFGTSFPLLGQTNPSLDGKITQLVGYAAHNDSTYTANSGVHASETRLFIEDQPDLSGLGATLLDKWLGLKSDFGTTHSITLIADALAVTDTLQKLKPDLTLDQAYELLATASNQRGSGLLGTSGSAEGDSLEQIAQALNKLYTGSASTLPVDRSSGGFGNRDNRNQFYDALAAVNTALKDKGDSLTVLANSNTGLNDLGALVATAKTDAGIAARYALLALQPFLVDNADPTRRAALYAAHNTHQELALADTDGTINNNTAVQRLEAAEVTLTRADGKVLRGAFVLDYFYKDQAGLDALRKEGQTASTGISMVNLGSGNDTFEGSAGRDIVDGGDDADRIDGAGGDDVLSGGAGNDHTLFSNSFFIDQFNQAANGRNYYKAA